MKVKFLRMLTSSVFVAAVLLCGERLLAGARMTSAGELESNPVIQFAGGYALTLLAFAACPNTRRGDLARLTFAGGALLCLIRAFTWRENMTGAMIGEALGAAAAVLPSTFERLRAALRADPEGPVSMRRSGERRVPGARRREPIFSRDSLARI